MGRRLISMRVNSKGELLVNSAADQAGAIQTSMDDLGGQQFTCVPVGGTNEPLTDRKYLLLTYPTDYTYTDRSEGQSFDVNTTSAYSVGCHRRWNEPSSASIHSPTSFGTTASFRMA